MLLHCHQSKALESRAVSIARNQQERPAPAQTFLHPIPCPQFCDDCWRGHLRVQINEGKARHVVCMAHKCNIVCDDELVAKVMKV